MANPVSTPHCPFDRLWQPGHPFRPRRSNKRRCTMGGLLIFFSAFIASYFYLTDPARINSMSKAYLSELVGGHVDIGNASLTLLEGLTLKNVRITTGDDKPGATLFYADNIEIQYNPASLLRGRLEATRIIATGANVDLVEEATPGHWNYQRLAHGQGKPIGTQPSKKTKLEYPELVLRNAQVHYSKVGDDNPQDRGDIAIEGHLYPSTDGSLYQFELQSSGKNEAYGPTVSGSMTLKSGRITARLANLKFGKDLQAMLPSQVREFWEAHDFQGQLDIPKFEYTPANGKHRATFLLQTQLENVQLLVRSEEFTATPVADIKPRKMLAAYPLLQKIDLSTRQLIAWKHLYPSRPPIAVNIVKGTFTFDQDGIQFDDINSTVAGVALVANGHISGYSSDARVKCDLKSADGIPVVIPEKPDFLASLPTDLHQAYTMLKPQGTGAFHVSIDGVLPNGLPRVNGEVDIQNGSLDSIFFPYPVRAATGKVVFGPDPTDTFELIKLENIQGHGVAGGPNENAVVNVSGWVSADPDRGCQIRVWAKDVFSEPVVFTAFPPPVRKVMTIFKGPGTETYPHFAGDFDCNVLVPPGQNMRPIVFVDLTFKNGGGKLAAFPYPLEQMTGQLTIRDGYLDATNLNFKHNGTSISVNGRVTWPVDTPPGADVIAKPDLKLVVHSLPLDHELFDVLPPEARGWLRSVGVTGMLEVQGNIVPKPNATVSDDSIRYDLNVQLHDGAAHPIHSEFAVKDVTGTFAIHPDRMEINELHGRRGDTTLAADGSVDWSTGRPTLKLNGSAQKLVLDTPLYGLLPASAQQAWSTLDPHGTLNAQLFYQGTCPAPPGEPIASLELPAGVILASSATPAGDFKLTLEPTDITVIPRPLPYRLDHCYGRVTITPKDITIGGIHAHHGNATIDLSGKGITNNPNDWDLSLAAHNLPADDDLRKAIPTSMRQVLDELKYKGNLSVDLKTFRYRGDRPEADVDLWGTFSAIKGSVEVGVPIDGIDAAVTFDAAVRNGKLAAFRGDADIEQMSMVDRPVKNLKAALQMPSGSDVLSATGIHGDVAGGELAGRMDLKFPDTGPATYSLDFQVKNADLNSMAKQVAPRGKEIKGQASASIALQGAWADPSTRRGRGDVLVTGKEVYQIPLLLGLLEVTNLSLPTSEPFSEGTARYLVEGNRITFEQVQMRSNSIVMSGNGWLDFGSKQVRMNFTTENPNLPKLPIVHDLWEGAKQELLQIQVRGTVQSPKVSAGALHTFTTTVDEVLSGSGKEK
jgi:hypothetical protein